MKLTFLTALMMMILLVSCGGKDKKSNSGAFGNALTTQEGFYNLQTQAIEVGSMIYPPSQQYAVVMNQALEQARMNRIQPVNINGAQKYRARITAMANNYQPINNGYNPSVPNQNGMTQATLNISSIQFY